MCWPGCSPETSAPANADSASTPVATAESMEVPHLFTGIHLLRAWGAILLSAWAAMLMDAAVRGSFLAFLGSVTPDSSSLRQIRRRDRFRQQLPERPRGRGETSVLV